MSILFSSILQFFSFDDQETLGFNIGMKFMFIQRNTSFDCEVVIATNALYIILLKLRINFFCVTCWNHFTTELTSIFIFIAEISIIMYDF